MESPDSIFAVSISLVYTFTFVPGMQVLLDALGTQWTPVTLSSALTSLLAAGTRDRKRQRDFVMTICRKVLACSLVGTMLLTDAIGLAQLSELYYSPLQV